MPVEVIDTLEIAHDLRSAGLTEPQAEAIARHFKRRYEADRQELVTREYLDHAIDKLRTELRDEINDVRGEVSSLRAHLDKELASIRAELRSEIATVRTEIASVRTEIAGVRTEIAGVRVEIERLVRDLLFKLAGLIVAAVAIVGALGVLF